MDGVTIELYANWVSPETPRLFSNQPFPQTAGRDDLAEGPVQRR